MKIIIMLLVLFVGMNCYADKYKKIEKQVTKYESIAISFENIKQIGDDFYSKGLIADIELEDLKAKYNRKYDKFIETAYLLEEIIIIEGELTMDDMLVPMSDRKGSINEIGRRRYNKSTNELLKAIDYNLNVLGGYIGEVYRYYGKKQRQEKEKIQEITR